MKICVTLLLLAAGAAFAAEGIVNSFGAPATDVTGLAYAQGSLYAVTASKTVYKLDPSDGTVQGSFTTAMLNAPNGIGYAGSLLYITNGTSTVYKYTLAGVAQSTTQLYCPG